MRKRSQLREILPIYPAMPFPPLARFDRRSTIQAKGIGPNDQTAPTGTHFREKSCRTGNENGAEMPCEPLISLQLPLLCSIGIVEVRTRGPKRKKKEEGVAIGSLASFSLLLL
jgi:hypothetical protein